MLAGSLRRKRSTGMMSATLVSATALGVSKSMSVSLTSVTKSPPRGRSAVPAQASVFATTAVACATVRAGMRPMAISGTPSRSASTNQSSDAVSIVAASMSFVGAKSKSPVPRKLRGSNVASPTRSTKRGGTRQPVRAAWRKSRSATAVLSPPPRSS